MPEKDTETAFLSEFVQARKDILAYIYSLVPSHAAAEDIFQRVSIVLWKRFDTYEPGTNFRAWSRKVAWNTVLNERRRRRREVYWAPEVLEALDNAFEEKEDALADMKCALAHCVEKLSAINRTILRHRYGREKTFEEIASLINRSQESIRVVLHRIRRKLRECIQREMKAETAG